MEALLYSSPPEGCGLFGGQVGRRFTAVFWVISDVPRDRDRLFWREMGCLKASFRYLLSVLK